MEGAGTSPPQSGRNIIRVSSLGLMGVIDLWLEGVRSALEVPHVKTPSS